MSAPPGPPGPPGPGPGWHGPPPAYPPQPARPRRPRPHGAWWLLPVVLLVAAVGLVLAVVVPAGTSMFSTEATVPLDGETHEVTVDSTEEKTVWVPVRSQGACELSNDDGSEIDLETVNAEITRSFGNGTYVAAYTFTPDSTTVRAQCTLMRGQPQGSVQLGPAVGSGLEFGASIAAIVGSIVLGLIALITVIVLGVRTATGAPRR